jgi:phage terminase large subunit-like protein
MSKRLFFPMNMNQIIFVRLSEAGKAVHRAAYDKLVADGLPSSVKYEYHEDEEGWSPWQFHVFCTLFGSYMDKMNNARSAVLKEFTILLPEQYLGPALTKDSAIKLNH